MIARKSVIVLSSQFFARFLGWLGLLVIVKLWGGFAPDALGQIAFAYSFVYIFNIIGDLGFGQAHVKRISEGQDIGTCIGTYITIKLILISLMVSIFFGSIFVWKFFFHGSFHDATTETIVYLFLIYFVIINLQQITSNTFNGKGQIAKLQINLITENIVKVPLMILFATAGVTFASIMAFRQWPVGLSPLQNYIASHAIGFQAIAYIIGIFSSLIVGIWLFRKYPIKRPNLVLAKSYSSFAIPSLLISVVLVISTNVDKIIIGFFWTSVEVGYYYSVQQIMLIILILSTAITTVLFPAFSQLHSSQDYNKIFETLRTAERYITLTIIPVVVVIIVFAKPIISIMLNSSFYPAIPVLIILSVYTIIYSLLALHTSLVIGLNKPISSAVNSTTICTLTIVFYFLFIPTWGILTPLGINGITGAAIATLVGTLAGYIQIKYIIKRLLKRNILPRKLPLHIIAGLIMGLFLVLLSTYIPIDRWYSVLLAALIGLLIYLAILFAMKEFTRNDLHFFLNILQPKELIKYITTEVKDEKENERK
jgi:O-antigen/teichoic acid export membrane protein